MPYSFTGSLVPFPLILLLGVLPSCSTSSPPPAWIETTQRLPLQSIKVDRHRISYLTIGEGPPVVLIHGFGGSIWNWEHQQADLASEFRVITLDLLGSGSSEKPTIAYTPHRMVQFFRDFMDALAINHATLVGNSMGAGLAMAMALTYPSRVERLVLISGFPANPREKVQSARYKQFLEHRPPLWLAKIGNWLTGRWATKSLLKELIYDSSFITPMIIERSYQNRNVTGFLSPLYSLLENMNQWEHEFGHRIMDIHHPTLILWGEHDRVFPVNVGNELHQVIPHSTFQIIPNAGHLPQWEQPSHVNTHIRRFLHLSHPKNQNS